MSRYLTPLPRLFSGAVETVLNRLIELGPGAPTLIAAMGDGVLKLELQRLNIDLFFQGAGDRLNVTAESEQTPATTLTGTPLALLAMAGPERKTPGGSVSISGDAELARRFEQLIRRLDPDWEVALAEHFGDFLGHHIYALMRESRRAARRTAAVGTEQLGAFLGVESGLLVSKQEFAGFADEVDALREAVDRLEMKQRR